MEYFHEGDIKVCSNLGTWRAHEICGIRMVYNLIIFLLRRYGFKLEINILTLTNCYNFWNFTGKKFLYNAAWLSATLPPALTHSWWAVGTGVNPLWVTSGLAVPTSACVFSDMIHDVLDPVTLLAQWLRNSGNNLVCCIPWPRPWRSLYLDEAR